MAAGDVTSAIVIVEGKKGVIFDGIDDEVKLAEPSVISGLKEWSISVNFLAKETPAASETHGIISDRSSLQSNNFFQLTLEDDLKLSYIIKDSAETKFDTDVSIDLHKWYNVVITFAKGGYMRLYFDGVFHKELAIADGETLTTRKLYIGTFYNRTAAYSFKGCIGNVQILNKELDATQVAQLYGNVPFPEYLIHKWDFEDDTYQDSVGSSNGVSSGTRISIFEDDLSAYIASKYTTANDRYLLTPASNGAQVVFTHIEEAP
jgi:hypothetical protein